MINKLRAALAIALVAVAGPVAALGLGQIQVKSRLDQPLLAEIEIISNDPAELEQLQARLASPDTFRRIGLEPPSGAAADLQFSVALDARGRPVIRVTSAAPINQPLVTFLIEVDWGQGRLVREYSALLDTPRTVAAPAQPPIQAPEVSSSNTIVQAPAAETTTETLEPEAIDPSEPAEGQPEAIATAPPEPIEAAPVDIPAPSSISGSAFDVHRGDTLSEIANRLDAGRGYSLDQTMLALLRANPEAFIHNNINLLKAGAVLRIPQGNEVAQLSATEAAAVVRDQIEQWQAMRQPAPQPAAVVDGGDAASASARSNAGARVAGDRLEIVPPSNGGNRPGTRSGASAGGEGEMLRQELQQSKEDLAARNAEVEELKTRVADLEKLQQQQQQLISMKDSELAAAQQRLADARKAAPAQVAANPAQPADKQAQTTITPWLWGGLGLIVLGLIAWLFTRRRSPAPEPTVRRSYDTAALAAGIPTLTGDATAPVIEEPAKQTQAPHRTAAPATTGATPTWHGGNAVAVTPAAPAEPASASQQIELARAYLDLGDEEAARILLREVLNGRDPVARETASRMLREL